MTREGVNAIACPTCGTTGLSIGYGLACGGIGIYTLCDCGELLDFIPEEEPEDAVGAP